MPGTLRANRILFAIKGRVRISRIIPGIGEQTLATLEAGSYFGEMEIFEAKPRAEQAVAEIPGF